MAEVEPNNMAGKNGKGMHTSFDTQFGVIYSHSTNVNATKTPSNYTNDYENERSIDDDVSANVGECEVEERMKSFMSSR